MNQGGEAYSHGTRKSFLVPLSVDTVLACVLFAIALPAGVMSMETIIPGVIFIVLFAVLILSLRKKVLVGPSGIAIQGFLKRKELAWGDITNVDALVMKKKAYLLFTTTRGFHVLSNNLAGFAAIVSRVFESAGDEKIEPAAKKLLEQVPRRMSDIILLWVAAGIMAGILCYKMIQ